MEYAPIGPTDQMISRIGFGTARYRGRPGVLGRAIELGVNLVDTAESYNVFGDEPGVAERIVGRELEAASGPAFVATKVSPQNLCYDDVITHAQASRDRLGIDTIDLYQIHGPNAAIPIEETMRAMETLVADGVIRFIGVSNFNVEQMEAARAELKSSPLVSNQVAFSLLHRNVEADILPYCQSNNITLIAHTPLALGAFQTGPAAEVIGALAAEVAKTPAQVMLRWLLDHDRVVVIPKTDRQARVDELCGASGWTLDPEQRAPLDALSA